MEPKFKLEFYASEEEAEEANRRWKEWLASEEGVAWVEQQIKEAAERIVQDFDEQALRILGYKDEDLPKFTKEQLKWARKQLREEEEQQRKDFIEREKFERKLRERR
jgi:hypothetical protein